MLPIQSDSRNLPFCYTHFWLWLNFFFHGSNIRSLLLRGNIVSHLCPIPYPQKSITDSETMAGVKPLTTAHEMSLAVSTENPWEECKGCSLYCMCIKFKWRVRNGYKTQWFSCLQRQRKFIARLDLTLTAV